MDTQDDKGEVGRRRVAPPAAARPAGAEARPAGPAAARVTSGDAPLPHGDTSVVTLFIPATSRNRRMVTMVTP